MRSAADMMDDNCIALFAAIIGGISAQKALERTGLYKPQSPTVDKSAMIARDGEIIRRQKSGELVPDIAKDMGVSKNTVYEALRRNGIFLGKKKW
ncbi:MAG: hypothetical protein PHE61_08835 [Candidatus Omnitrophica bacterium]|nr:hypothetical protein [Candidatus Omnitrophota bacterium]